MTNKQFYEVWGAALASEEREAFVSDWALSSLFCDPEETEPVSQELIDQLGQIWDVAHMGVKEIRTSMGASQAEFAVRFCIPKRTLENWETTSSSHRDCPSYVKLLLAESIGLVRR